jgi:regulator of protease activity HflC (stomatin/prohibitin superfamily)
LAKREEINTLLRTKLDEVTERWGVKVTTVEIREIDPPKDVQDAMNKQMAAERTRRAIVLEADGKKQYAITVAEGERQSKILSAEGDRQAEILKAEGHAKALENIFAAAKLVDDKTISLQYLETLKIMGQGASTKYIFPMEFLDFIKPIAERIGRANSSKG